MTIRPHLELRQSQTLTMTPQLQQAIKLLQMSSLELQEYVEAELIKNPLLDRDELADGERVDPEKETNAALKWDNAQQIAEQVKNLEEHRRNKNDVDEWVEDRDKQSGLDADFDAALTGESLAEKNNITNENQPDFDAGSSSIGSGGNMQFESSDYNLENSISGKKNLREYLTEQMFLEVINAKDRMVGIVLIDFLDDAGYLREDLKTLKKEIGCSEKRLKTVLKIMQRLQPTGIFAHNLEECLALQLKELNRFDPAMQALIRNINLLAAHDIKKLCRICHVDMDDLKDMIVEVKALNPKPAAEFDNFISQTVIADILMKKLPKDQGGGWGVELNNETLPRVLVNRRYYTEVKASVKKKEEKEYLSEQMTSAKWLVKTLDQRANTILKVAKEIIRRQDAFFAYGVEYLKPMVLREIAEAIEMHESTISRVTNNKYIGTPRGVFELRYFFTRGLASSNEGGSDHSAQSVKAKIKQFIDEEDPKKILSDGKLVKLLKNSGIEVARRTVAKYREAIKIPSSVQRRREKRIDTQ